MVRYKFKHGKSPASQAPRMSRVAYSEPTDSMKPVKIVVKDQTMQSPVKIFRGVNFFMSTAHGDSNKTYVT
jgi:hypothetical protein